MNDELRRKIQQFMGDLAQNCAYLLSQDSSFGFNIKFMVGDKRYCVSLGEQTTEWEYLKDN